MNSSRAGTALHGGEMEEENCGSEGPVCKCQSSPSPCFTEQSARVKNISFTPWGRCEDWPCQQCGLPRPSLDALLRVPWQGQGHWRWGWGTARGDPRAAALGRGRKRQSDFILQHSSDTFVPYPAVLELCKAQLWAQRGLSPWLLIQQKGALYSAHKHLPKRSQHPASPSHGEPETSLDTCTGEFPPLLFRAELKSNMYIVTLL